MIYCVLQYIFCFSNVVFVVAFCAYSLCCQPREVQYGTKVKTLILLPLFPTLFTAGVATYYFFTQNEAECILFGSDVAMLAIDFVNQIIFVIGIVFINSMEVVFTKIRAGRLGHSPQETEAQLARIKRTMALFVTLYLILETVILTLKSVIYSSKDFSHAPTLGAIPVTFLTLHGLRAVFPVTLMVKFLQQIRVYLSEFKEHLNSHQRAKTVAVTVLVTFMLVLSALWYNFVVQYYYIVHLKMQQPSKSTDDEYFSAVYYTNVVVNELIFCLLIGMAAVVIKFSRVRSRRIHQSKQGSQAGKRRSNSETSVYRSPEGGATKVESRGDKPVARDSFLIEEQERQRHKQSCLIHDASTATGLLDHPCCDQLNQADVTGETTSLLRYIGEQAPPKGGSPGKHCETVGAVVVHPSEQTQLLSNESGILGGGLLTTLKNEIVIEQQVEEEFYKSPSEQSRSELQETQGPSESSDENYRPGRRRANRKSGRTSTSNTSQSVLDKLQDLVESELYGKSRALVIKNKDSMIDCSSYDGTQFKRQNSSLLITQQSNPQ